MSSTYYGFHGEEQIHTRIETAVRKAAKNNITQNKLYALEHGQVREPYDWEVNEFEIYMREYQ